MKEGASPKLFISFSSRDLSQARDVVAHLESQGLPCWISSRDVAPGGNFQEAIVQALEAARGVVFLFSEHSSTSAEVKKELALAGSIDKPVFPVRLSPILPQGALRYELATRQWVDVFEDYATGLASLAHTIQAALRNGSGDVSAPIPGETPPETHAVPDFGVNLSGAQLEAVSLLLARHIGPIARLVVQKSANQSSTADEFCHKLAGYVPVASDQAKFSAAVRHQLDLDSGGARERTGPPGDPRSSP